MPGSLQLTIPTLQTERLVLRAPAEADFETYRVFFADEVASREYGGPMSATEAWRKLARDLGHWALRGYGMWTIAHKETGDTVGGCGIVWPEGWPRSELTWWIVPAHRRNGFALEASRAAILFAYDTLHWSHVETHMDDSNAPARRLAEKLGGEIMCREQFPDGLERNVYMLPRLQVGAS